MAKYQVSPNLIEQVQILLRKEAIPNPNSDSFNPNHDHSLLPPPPTLDAAIAGFDSGANDNNVRCKQCKGELLRGLESIICVYCGCAPQQGHDSAIPFKSTLGFGWLLESLSLDASENVGPPVGEAQTDKGRSLLKDEISLSDFLDLELKWPDESKSFGRTSEAQLPGKKSLNLVGVDVNDLFAEGHCNSQLVVTSEKIETKEATTVPGQRELSLFQNTQSSEAALQSDEGENDESLSGWEAEFQSSVPDARDEHLQRSLDVYKDPPVNYASHMGSIVGPVEQEKSANISSSDACLRSNLSSKDLLSNSNFHSKQSEGTSLVENGVVTESVSSSRFNGLLEDQRNATCAHPHDEKRVGDDSFDEWKELRICTGAENNQCEPSGALAGAENSGGLDTFDVWNDFTGSVGVGHNQHQTNIFEVPDNGSLPSWNNFTNSSTTEDIQLHTRSTDICQQARQEGVGNPMHGGGNDFALLTSIHHGQQDVHTESAQNKISGQDDSVALWSTGLGSAIQDDQLQVRESKSPASGNNKEVDDSFDLWNDFKSSVVEHDIQQEANNTKVADNKMTNEGDSTVDVWNSFATFGAGGKEQHISSTKAVDSKRNGAHDDSFVSWNDSSFDAWSDFAGSTGVSHTQPISDDTSFGAWNDFSSSTITLADQHQSCGKTEAVNQNVLEDDDTFSSWSDLSSLGTHTKSSFPIPNVTGYNQDQMIVGKAADELPIVKDNSPFSSWDDFAHSMPIVEKQKQHGGAELSENGLTSGAHEFFGGSDSGKQSMNPPDNELKPVEAVVCDGKSISETDDLFDAWSDFTSSSNVQASHWPSSSANAPNDEEAVKCDDPIGAWNLFVSSPDVQAVNDTAVEKGNTREINLFSKDTDLHAVESSHSLRADLLAGMFSGCNDSAQVAVPPPELPDLLRTQSGDVRADGNPEQMNGSETASRETMDRKKSVDVEFLISEMHDLSFMLESGLSVPKSGG